MIICNLRDQDFFYDVIAPQNEMLHVKKELAQENNELPRMDSEEPENLQDNNVVTKGKKKLRSFIKSILYNPIGAQDICWPYFSFSGLDEYLWVFNAFDQEYMNRIELPRNDGLDIVLTFISQDY